MHPKGPCLLAGLLQVLLVLHACVLSPLDAGLGA